MHKANLAAFAGFSPTDVLLLSGYWPVMGASVALLTSEGRLVVALPDDEVDLAKASTDAELIPFKPETLDSVQSFCEATEAPAHEMARIIPLSTGSIGTSLDAGEQGTPYQSVNRFRSDAKGFLAQAFPNTRVIAADSILAAQRSARTAIELDQLRKACALVRTGFDAAVPAIAAGRREDEVAADIESAFARVALNGFERGRGFFFCMSGPNSAKAAGAYAQTRRRKLEPGDLVMIHTNTVGDGSWTDVTRTYTVGDPSPQQTAMFDAVRQARQAALEAICPGACASHVDAAARTVLDQRGFGANFPHAVGHGVGFAATDPNALPRMHPKSPDVLAPGMTFNIEPAIYFDGVGGIRHCDVVAVTDHGVEVLTDF